MVLHGYRWFYMVIAGADPKEGGVWGQNPPSGQPVLYKIYRKMVKENDPEPLLATFHPTFSHSASSLSIYITYLYYNH
jgi:hypothetical protein